jgi:predicted nucleic acid-binding protein
MVDDGPEVRERLLSLLATYPVAGKQVHDANIVATMLANDVTRLLTFNIADFRRFAELIAIEAP